MALNIKSDEAHRLARELADATGTTLTEAVTQALRSRIQTEARERSDEEAMLLAEVEEIQRLVAALPDRDMRAADEILGYDAHGLPG